jgi:peroxiredoxin
MRQLGQLQKDYAKFKEYDAEIVCVFREEELGAEGLKRSKAKCKAEFPLVSDWKKKTTGPYSPEGFATYVIDREGVIRTVLNGTKSRRPTSAAMLKKLSQIAEKK